MTYPTLLFIESWSPDCYDEGTNQNKTQTTSTQSLLLYTTNGTRHKKEIMCGLILDDNHLRPFSYKNKITIVLIVFYAWEWKSTWDNRAKKSNEIQLSYDDKIQILYSIQLLCRWAISILYNIEHNFLMKRNWIYWIKTIYWRKTNWRKNRLKNYWWRFVQNEDHSGRHSFKDVSWQSQGIFMYRMLVSFNDRMTSN